MSYLRKVRFTIINGVPVDAAGVYGYIEYLTSEPVKDPQTGLTSQKIIGVYHIDGTPFSDVSNTFWQTLPLYAHVWNDTDFQNAIETFRELTE